MEKNVAVTDEYGKYYTPTYPKRAEGLIKHGRARRVDEHTICLARPPIQKLEDAEMDQTSGSEPKSGTAAGGKSPDLSYILEKIDQIMADTAHIYSSIQAIENMPVNETLNGGFDGQARAEALGNIVQAREATNQRLIGLLEKFYEDLCPARAQDQE